MAQVATAHHGSLALQSSFSFMLRPNACGLGHALDSGLASRERGIGDEEGEIDVETKGRGEKRNEGETI